MCTYLSINARRKYFHFFLIIFIRVYKTVLEVFILNQIYKKCMNFYKTISILKRAIKSYHNIKMTNERGRLKSQMQAHK